MPPHFRSLHIGRLRKNRVNPLGLANRYSGDVLGDSRAFAFWLFKFRF